ncbi:MAG: hypothetical protein ABW292_17280 [Vicinamibacterales bacterium]|jgi:hypothetical protein
MRSIVNKSWMLAVAFLGLCAGSAHAQEVVVNVPFPFVVQQQTMPAGEYVVERVGQGQDALLIRRTKGVGNSAVIVLTTPASGFDPSGDKPALTFTRDENAYRLSTIWESHTEGRTLGRG